MNDRFSHISSNPARAALDKAQVSHCETKVKGKKELNRIGRDSYDTLMSLLSEDRETPETPYGVLIANSTKRNLRKQIESLFIP